MIEIKRDGTKLTLTIEHGLPTDTPGPGSLLLTWDAGRDVLASALVVAVQDHLAARIESVRKAEYEAGWKAARLRMAVERQRARRTWFFRDLRPGDGR